MRKGDACEQIVRRVYTFVSGDVPLHLSPTRRVYLKFFLSPSLANLTKECSRCPALPFPLATRFPKLPTPSTTNCRNRLGGVCPTCLASCRIVLTHSKASSACSARLPE